MSKYKALVIGGSAGSFPLVIQILSSLPANFPLPIFLCLHRLKHIRTGYLEALSLKSKITIVEPHDKQTIKPGIAYLAPSNYHMLIELGNTISLSTDEMVKYSRPSIDLTFETAGYVYKDKMVGIMLSGANTDGAEGMRKSIDRGAYAVAQNPEEATIRTMPDAAINAAKMDQILPIDAICKFINDLAK
jgi:two-component system chemotaxis response regulator CheB